MGDRGFDLDFSDGEFGEKLLSQILKGKIEVKTDERAFETKNVVVEFTYKGNDSGIRTTTADWWSFVLSGSHKKEVIVMIKTSRLKELIAKNNYQTACGGDNYNSSMYKVPLKDLIS